jgi:hypothetical protein
MENALISNLEIAVHRIGGKNIYVGWAPITLNVWDGYLTDPYRKKGQAIGWSGVGIANCKEDEDGFLAGPEHHAAYFNLVDRQQEIRQRIISELKERFPNLLANEYAFYDIHSDLFPQLDELTGEFDFREYIGPASINIEKDVKDGLAYVTWHFHCTWDTEHGFEVITHGERIIEMAPQADLWKINEDNGSDNSRASDELQYTQIQVTKKKWWKFW